MFRMGCVAVLIGAVSATAWADKVQLNNGDVLTGTVASVDGGKMVIKTEMAGDVTVDLKNVKTFTTDKPVDLRTSDGQRISARAVADQPGTVKVEGAGAPRSLPLTQLKSINFNENWTGAVVAGAMFARGNTYADQASIAFDAIRRSEIDRWTFGGAYNFGRQREPGTGDKTTTTDNWFAQGKYDYFFNEKFYGFASLRVDHDRIAALNYRATPSLGLGYQWIETPNFKFDTEGGLAYICESFSDDTSNSAIAVRLAYHLKYGFNEKVGMFHNLEYFPSLEALDDYLVVTDIGVRAALTASMFAEYKIEFRYDATPAPGASRSDLRHIVGVGWRF